MKEFRVAAAVIPALKDKSIERDFRTLKRDRLVADIPMWDICFFFSVKIEHRSILVGISLVLSL